MNDGHLVSSRCFHVFIFSFVFISFSSVNENGMALKEGHIVAYLRIKYNIERSVQRVEYVFIRLREHSVCVICAGGYVFVSVIPG